MGARTTRRVRRGAAPVGRAPRALPVCLPVARAPRGDRVALTDRTASRSPSSTSRTSTSTTPAGRPCTASARPIRRIPASRASSPSRGLYLAGNVTVFPGRAAVRRAGARPARHASRSAPNAAGGASPASRRATHPPRARVPDQGRTRDRRRPSAAPAGRRDQGGRRAGRDSRRLLPGLLDRYYPPTASSSRRSPPPCATRGPREAIWHAICRKTTAARTSSSAATTPASATTTAPTTHSSLRRASSGPELGIEPLFFEHSFFCRACGPMATREDVPPRHRPARVPLRDEVREMLGAGECAARGVLAAGNRRGADRGLPGLGPTGAEGHA